MTHLSKPTSVALSLCLGFACLPPNSGPSPDAGAVPAADSAAPSAPANRDAPPASPDTPAPADRGGAPDAPRPGTEGPAADSEAMKVCKDTAAGFCAKLEACSPFGLTVTYGDLARCEQRFAVGCLIGLRAPGTSLTRAKTEACAQALATLSCERLVAGDYGPCNPEPGSRDNGGGCTDDSQCVSTFCARAANAACGRCSAATTAGAPCVNESCSRGLACPAGGGTCIVPMRGKVGDPCTSLEQCDLASGVGCNTISRKCIRLTTAQPGAACGATDISGMTFAVCAAGSCSAVVGGRCTAAAADGAACSDAETGPRCLLPARCVRGTCRLPDPASCQ